MKMELRVNDKNRREGAILNEKVLFQVPVLMTFPSSLFVTDHTKYCFTLAVIRLSHFYTLVMNETSAVLGDCATSTSPPDIIVLTQGYYHWGTHLNAMKRLCF